MCEKHFNKFHLPTMNVYCCPCCGATVSFDYEPTFIFCPKCGEQVKDFPDIPDKPNLKGV